MPEPAAATLEELVEAKLRPDPGMSLEPYLRELRNRVGAKSEAILAYGSTLSETTRKSTSAPDFYVLTRGYFSFHDSILHAVLNFFLPPNIYHLPVGSGLAKYNVISLYDLKHETSLSAFDVYHLGRFSKRMVVAWARNKEAIQAAVNAQASAIRSVARRTYYLVGATFELESFVRQALAISYYGEMRVEAEDKVDRLLAAEKSYYLDVYAAALRELESSSWLQVQEGNQRRYQKNPKGNGELCGNFRLRMFLKRSRLRAKLRWPKGIFTVANWIDYLIAKIERTQGIKIQLTERQRKLWFIYGWKYYFSLKRKNVLK